MPFGAWLGSRRVHSQTTDTPLPTPPSSSSSSSSSAPPTLREWTEFLSDHEAVLRASSSFTRLERTASGEGAPPRDGDGDDGDDDRQADEGSGAEAGDEEAIREVAWSEWRVTKTLDALLNSSVTFRTRLTTLDVAQASASPPEAGGATEDGRRGRRYVPAVRTESWAPLGVHVVSTWLLLPQDGAADTVRGDGETDPKADATPAATTTTTTTTTTTVRALRERLRFSAPWYAFGLVKRQALQTHADLPARFERYLVEHAHADPSAAPTG